MRTYGRISNNPQDRFAPKRWVVIETAANGLNSAVFITALAQVLKLNLNESPFYGNWGIPAHPSVAQQVAPDIYVVLTQMRFAQQFASLIIAKVPGIVTPTYNITATTVAGTKLTGTMEVPQ